MFAEATFCIVFPEPVGGSDWDLSVGDTPDFEHVTQVSKQAVAKLNVDPAAVYLVGYSRGGVFGYKMMCSLAKLPFVAYASIESQPLYIETNKGKECCPDLKFHLMAVQGSDDTTFPPNQLRATDPAARTHFCADQPELVAQHGRANACAGPVEQQATIMPATRITAYESGCDAGGSASLYMVGGGTHTSILGNALWRQIWQYFTVVAPASGP